MPQRGTREQKEEDDPDVRTFLTVASLEVNPTAEEDGIEIETVSSREASREDQKDNRTPSRSYTSTTSSLFSAAMLSEMTSSGREVMPLMPSSLVSVPGAPPLTLKLSVCCGYRFKRELLMETSTEAPNQHHHDDETSDHVDNATRRGKGGSTKFSQVTKSSASSRSSSLYDIFLEVLLEATPFHSWSREEKRALFPLELAQLGNSETHQWITSASRSRVGGFRDDPETPPQTTTTTIPTHEADAEKAEEAVPSPRTPPAASSSSLETEGGGDVLVLITGKSIPPAALQRLQAQVRLGTSTASTVTRSPSSIPLSPGVEMQLKITRQVLDCKCPHTLLVRPSVWMQPDHIPGALRLHGVGAHCQEAVPELIAPPPPPSFPAWDSSRVVIHPVSSPNHTPSHRREEEEEEEEAWGDASEIFDQHVVHASSSSFPLWKWRTLRKPMMETVKKGEDKEEEEDHHHHDVEDEMLDSRPRRKELDFSDSISNASVPPSSSPSRKRKKGTIMGVSASFALEYTLPTPCDPTSIPPAASHAERATRSSSSRSRPTERPACPEVSAPLPPGSVIEWKLFELLTPSHGFEPPFTRPSKEGDERDIHDRSRPASQVNLAEVARHHSLPFSLSHIETLVSLQDVEGLESSNAGGTLVENFSSSIPLRQTLVYHATQVIPAAHPCRGEKEKDSSDDWKRDGTSTTVAASRTPSYLLPSPFMPVEPHAVYRVEATVRRPRLHERDAQWHPTTIHDPTSNAEEREAATTMEERDWDSTPYKKVSGLFVLRVPFPSFAPVIPSGAARPTSELGIRWSSAFHGSSGKETPSTTTTGSERTMASDSVSFASASFSPFLTRPTVHFGAFRQLELMSLEGVKMVKEALRWENTLQFRPSFASSSSSFSNTTRDRMERTARAPLFYGYWESSSSTPLRTPATPVATSTSVSISSRTPSLTPPPLWHLAPGKNILTFFLTDVDRVCPPLPVEVQEIWSLQALWYEEAPEGQGVRAHSHVSNEVEDAKNLKDTIKTEEEDADNGSSHSDGEVKKKGRVGSFFHSFFHSEKENNTTNHSLHFDRKEKEDEKEIGFHHLLHTMLHTAITPPHAMMTSCSGAIPLRASSSVFEVLEAMQEEVDTHAPPCTTLTKKEAGCVARPPASSWVPNSSSMEDQYWELLKIELSTRSSSSLRKPLHEKQQQQRSSTTSNSLPRRTRRKKAASGFFSCIPHAVRPLSFSSTSSSPSSPNDAKSGHTATTSMPAARDLKTPLDPSPKTPLSISQMLSLPPSFSKWNQTATEKEAQEKKPEEQETEEENVSPSTSFRRNAWRSHRLQQVEAERLRAQYRSLFLSWMHPDGRSRNSSDVEDGIEEEDEEEEEEEATTRDVWEREGGCFAFTPEAAATYFHVATSSTPALKKDAEEENDHHKEEWNDEEWKEEEEEEEVSTEDYHLLCQSFRSTTSSASPHGERRRNAWERISTRSHARRGRPSPSTSEHARKGLATTTTTTTTTTERFLLTEEEGEDAIRSPTQNFWSVACSTPTSSCSSFSEEVFSSTSSRSRRGGISSTSSKGGRETSASSPLRGEHNHRMVEERVWRFHRTTTSADEVPLSSSHGDAGPLASTHTVLAFRSPRTQPTTSASFESSSSSSPSWNEVAPPVYEANWAADFFLYHPDQLKAINFDPLHAVLLTWEDVVGESEITYDPVGTSFTSSPNTNSTMAKDGSGDSSFSSFTRKTNISAVPDGVPIAVVRVLSSSLLVAPRATVPRRSTLFSSSEKGETFSEPSGAPSSTTNTFPSLFSVTLPMHAKYLEISPKTLLESITDPHRHGGSATTAPQEEKTLEKEFHGTSPPPPSKETPLLPLLTKWKKDLGTTTTMGEEGEGVPGATTDEAANGETEEETVVVLLAGTEEEKEAETTSWASAFSSSSFHGKWIWQRPLSMETIFPSSDTRKPASFSFTEVVDPHALTSLWHTARFDLKEVPSVPGRLKALSPSSSPYVLAYLLVDQGVLFLDEVGDPHRITCPPRLLPVSLFLTPMPVEPIPPSSCGVVVYSEDSCVALSPPRPARKDEEISWKVLACREGENGVLKTREGEEEAEGTRVPPSSSLYFAGFYDGENPEEGGGRRKWSVSPTRRSRSVFPDTSWDRDRMTWWCGLRPTPPYCDVQWRATNAISTTIQTFSLRRCVAPPPLTFLPFTTTTNETRTSVARGSEKGTPQQKHRDVLQAFRYPSLIPATSSDGIFSTTPTRAAHTHRTSSARQGHFFRVAPPRLGGSAAAMQEEGEMNDNPTDEGMSDASSPMSFHGGPRRTLIPLAGSPVGLAEKNVQHKRKSFARDACTTTTSVSKPEASTEEAKEKQRSRREGNEEEEEEEEERFSSCASDSSPSAGMIRYRLQHVTGMTTFSSFSATRGNDAAASTSSPSSVSFLIDVRTDEKELFTSQRLVTTTHVSTALRERWRRQRRSPQRNPTESMEEEVEEEEESKRAWHEVDPLHVSTSTPHPLYKEANEGGRVHEASPLGAEGLKEKVEAALWKRRQHRKQEEASTTAGKEVEGAEVHDTKGRPHVAGTTGSCAASSLRRSHRPLRIRVVQNKSHRPTTASSASPRGNGLDTQEGREEEEMENERQKHDGVSHQRWREDGTLDDRLEWEGEEDEEEEWTTCCGASSCVAPSSSSMEEKEEPQRNGNETSPTTRASSCRRAPTRTRHRLHTSLTLRGMWETSSASSSFYPFSDMEKDVESELKQYCFYEKRTPRRRGASSFLFGVEGSGAHEKEEEEEITAGWSWRGSGNQGPPRHDSEEGGAHYLLPHHRSSLSDDDDDEALTPTGVEEDGATMYTTSEPWVRALPSSSYASAGRSWGTEEEDPSEEVHESVSTGTQRRRRMTTTTTTTHWWWWWCAEDYEETTQSLRRWRPPPGRSSRLPSSTTSSFQTQHRHHRLWLAIQEERWEDGILEEEYHRQRAHDVPAENDDAATGTPAFQDETKEAYEKKSSSRTRTMPPSVFLHDAEEARLGVHTVATSALFPSKVVVSHSLYQSRRPLRRTTRSDCHTEEEEERENERKSRKKHSQNGTPTAFSRPSSSTTTSTQSREAKKERSSFSDEDGSDTTAATECPFMVYSTEEDQRAFAALGLCQQHQEDIAFMVLSPKGVVRMDERYTAGRPFLETIRLAESMQPTTTTVGPLLSASVFQTPILPAASSSSSSSWRIPPTHSTPLFLPKAAQRLLDEQKVAGVIPFCEADYVFSRHPGLEEELGYTFHWSCEDPAAAETPQQATAQMEMGTPVVPREEKGGGGFSVEELEPTHSIIHAPTSSSSSSPSSVQYARCGLTVFNRFTNTSVTDYFLLLRVLPTSHTKRKSRGRTGPTGEQRSGKKGETAFEDSTSTSDAALHSPIGKEEGEEEEDYAVFNVNSWNVLIQPPPRRAGKEKESKKAAAASSSLRPPLYTVRRVVGPFVELEAPDVPSLSIPSTASAFSSASSPHLMERFTPTWMFRGFLRGGKYEGGRIVCREVLQEASSSSVEASLQRMCRYVAPLFKNNDAVSSAAATSATSSSTSENENGTPASDEEGRSHIESLVTLTPLFVAPPREDRERRSSRASSTTTSQEEEELRTVGEVIFSNARVRVTGMEEPGLYSFVLHHLDIDHPETCPMHTRQEMFEVFRARLRMTEADGMILDEAPSGRVLPIVEDNKEAKHGQTWMRKSSPSHGFIPSARVCGSATPIRAVPLLKELQHEFFGQWEILSVESIPGVEEPFRRYFSSSNEDDEEEEVEEEEKEERQHNASTLSSSSSTFPRARRWYRGIHIHQPRAAETVIEHLPFGVVTLRWAIYHQVPLSDSSSTTTSTTTPILVDEVGLRLLVLTENLPLPHRLPIIRTLGDHIDLFTSASTIHWRILSDPEDKKDEKGGANDPLSRWMEEEELNRAPSRQEDAKGGAELPPSSSSSKRRGSSRRWWDRTQETLKGTGVDGRRRAVPARWISQEETPFFSEEEEATIRAIQASLVPSRTTTSSDATDTITGVEEEMEAGPPRPSLMLPSHLILARQEEREEKDAAHQRPRRPFSTSSMREDGALSSFILTYTRAGSRRIRINNLPPGRTTLAYDYVASPSLFGKLQGHTCPVRSSRAAHEGRVWIQRGIPGVRVDTSLWHECSAYNGEGEIAMCVEALEAPLGSSSRASSEEKTPSTTISARRNGRSEGDTSTKDAAHSEDTSETAERSSSSSLLARTLLTTGWNEAKWYENIYLSPWIQSEWRKHQAPSSSSTRPLPSSSSTGRTLFPLRLGALDRLEEVVKQGAREKEKSSIVSGGCSTPWWTWPTTTWSQLSFFQWPSIGGGGASVSNSNPSSTSTTSGSCARLRVTSQQYLEAQTLRHPLFLSMQHRTASKEEVEMEEGEEVFGSSVCSSGEAFLSTEMLDLSALEGFRSWELFFPTFFPDFLSSSSSSRPRSFHSSGGEAKRNAEQDEEHHHHQQQQQQWHTKREAQERTPSLSRVEKWSRSGFFRSHHISFGPSSPYLPIWGPLRPPSEATQSLLKAAASSLAPHPSHSTNTTSSTSFPYDGTTGGTKEGTNRPSLAATSLASLLFPSSEEHTPMASQKVEGGSGSGSGGWLTRGWRRATSLLRGRRRRVLRVVQNTGASSATASLGPGGDVIPSRTILASRSTSGLQSLLNEEARKTVEEEEGSRTSSPTAEAALERKRIIKRRKSKEEEEAASEALEWWGRPYWNGGSMLPIQGGATTEQIISEMDISEGEWERFERRRREHQLRWKDGPRSTSGYGMESLDDMEEEEEMEEAAAVAAREEEAARPWLMFPLHLSWNAPSAGYYAKDLHALDTVNVKGIQVHGTDPYAAVFSTSKTSARHDEHQREGATSAPSSSALYHVVVPPLLQKCVQHRVRGEDILLFWSEERPSTSHDMRPPTDREEDEAEDEEEAMRWRRSKMEDERRRRREAEAHDASSRAWTSYVQAVRSSMVPCKPLFLSLQPLVTQYQALLQGTVMGGGEDEENDEEEEKVEASHRKGTTKNGAMTAESAGSFFSFRRQKKEAKQCKAPPSPRRRVLRLTTTKTSPGTSSEGTRGEHPTGDPSPLEWNTASSSSTAHAYVTLSVLEEQLHLLEKASRVLSVMSSTPRSTTTTHTRQKSSKTEMEMEEEEEETNMAAGMGIAFASPVHLSSPHRQRVWGRPGYPIGPAYGDHSGDSPRLRVQAALDRYQGVLRRYYQEHEARWFSPRSFSGKRSTKRPEEETEVEWRYKKALMWERRKQLLEYVYIRDFYGNSPATAEAARGGVEEGWVSEDATTTPRTYGPFAASTSPPMSRSSITSLVSLHMRLPPLPAFHISRDVQLHSILHKGVLCGLSLSSSSSSPSFLTSSMLLPPSTQYSFLEVSVSSPTAAIAAEWSRRASVPLSTSEWSPFLRKREPSHDTFVEDVTHAAQQRAAELARYLRSATTTTATRITSTRTSPLLERSLESFFEWEHREQCSSRRPGDGDQKDLYDNEDALDKEEEEYMACRTRSERLEVYAPFYAPISAAFVPFGILRIRDAPPRWFLWPRRIKQCEVEGHIPLLTLEVRGAAFSRSLGWSASLEAREEEAEATKASVKKVPPLSIMLEEVERRHDATGISWVSLSAPPHVEGAAMAGQGASSASPPLPSDTSSTTTAPLGHSRTTSETEEKAEPAAATTSVGLAPCLGSFHRDMQVVLSSKDQRDVWGDPFHFPSSSSSSSPSFTERRRRSRHQATTMPPDLEVMKGHQQEPSHARYEGEEGEEWDGEEREWDREFERDPYYFFHLQLPACPSFQMLAPEEYDQDRESEVLLQRLREPRFLRVTIHHAMEPIATTTTIVSSSASSNEKESKERGRAAGDVVSTTNKTNATESESVEALKISSPRVWENVETGAVSFIIEVIPTMARLHMRSPTQQLQRFPPGAIQVRRARSSSSSSSLSWGDPSSLSFLSSRRLLGTQGSKRRNDVAVVGMKRGEAFVPQPRGGNPLDASSPSSTAGSLFSFLSSTFSSSASSRLPLLVCENQLKSSGFALGVELIGDSWRPGVGEHRVKRRGTSETSARRMPKTTIEEAMRLQERPEDDPWASRAGVPAQADIFSAEDRGKQEEEEMVSVSMHPTVRTAENVALLNSFTLVESGVQHPSTHPLHGRGGGFYRSHFLSYLFSHVLGDPVLMQGFSFITRHNQSFVSVEIPPTIRPEWVASRQVQVIQTGRAFGAYEEEDEVPLVTVDWKSEASPQTMSPSSSSSSSVGSSLSHAVAGRTHEDTSRTMDRVAPGAKGTVGSTSHDNPSSSGLSSETTSATTAVGGRTMTTTPSSSSIVRVRGRTTVKVRRFSTVEEMVFTIPGITTHCRGCLVADTTFFVVGDFGGMIFFSPTTLWNIGMLEGATAGVRPLPASSSASSLEHQEEKETPTRSGFFSHFGFLLGTRAAASTGTTRGTGSTTQEHWEPPTSTASSSSFSSSESTEEERWWEALSVASWRSLTPRPRETIPSVPETVTVSHDASSFSSSSSNFFFLSASHLRDPLLLPGWHLSTVDHRNEKQPPEQRRKEEEEEKNSHNDVESFFSKERRERIPGLSATFRYDWLCPHGGYLATQRLLAPYLSRFHARGRTEPTSSSLFFRLEIVTFVAEDSKEEKNNENEWARNTDLSSTTNTTESTPSHAATLLLWRSEDVPLEEVYETSASTLRTSTLSSLATPPHPQAKRASPTEQEEATNEMGTTFMRSEEEKKTMSSSFSKTRNQTSLPRSMRTLSSVFPFHHWESGAIGATPPHKGSRSRRGVRKEDEGGEGPQQEVPSWPDSMKDASFWTSSSGASPPVLHPVLFRSHAESREEKHTKEEEEGRTSAGQVEHPEEIDQSVNAEKSRRKAQGRASTPLREAEWAAWRWVHVEAEKMRQAMRKDVAAGMKRRQQATTSVSNTQESSHHGKDYHEEPAGVDDEDVPTGSVFYFTRVLSTTTKRGGAPPLSSSSFVAIPERMSTADALLGKEEEEDGKTTSSAVFSRIPPAPPTSSVSLALNASVYLSVCTTRPSSTSSSSTWRGSPETSATGRRSPEMERKRFHETGRHKMGEAWREGRRSTWDDDCTVVSISDLLLLLDAPGERKSQLISPLLEAPPSWPISSLTSTMRSTMITTPPSSSLASMISQWSPPWDRQSFRMLLRWVHHGGLLLWILWRHRSGGHPGKASAVGHVGGRRHTGGVASGASRSRFAVSEDESMVERSSSSSWFLSSFPFVAWCALVATSLAATSSASSSSFSVAPLVVYTSCWLCMWVVLLVQSVTHEMDTRKNGNDGEDTRNTRARGRQVAYHEVAKNTSTPSWVVFQHVGFFLLSVVVWHYSI